jgi:hypothetical protein
MPFRSRRVRPGDDSGAAILLALFVIAVVAALSVGIAGIVLSQSEPTQLTRKDIQTVHAAEAGIQAGLTRLRAAGTGGVGSVAKLPCNNTYGATFAGSVDGTSTGSLTYSTTITYYSQNPSYPSFRNDSNRVACSPASVVPSYALVTSTGLGSVAVAGHAASTGNRKLEAVYSFNLTNANVSGGIIQLFQTTSPALCISANTVAVNQRVSLAKCDDTDPKQLWSYNPDLSISLTGFGDSLCLYASPNNNTSTYVTLNTCNVTPTLKNGQVVGYKNGSEQEVWSFNEAGEYQGTNSSAGEISYCFVAATDPKAATIGTGIKLTTTCNAGHDSLHTWQPYAKVGAGHAGDSTGQLVNYKEFGRCLDITGWMVDAAELIDYPCKQTPNPSSVDANQAWTVPNNNNPVGQIKSLCTSSNGCKSNTRNQTYPVCLQAGTKSAAPAPGTRVLTVACDSSNKQQQWTATGQTNNNATNFNFKTNNGLCLSIDQAAASLDKGIPWAYIIVENCDGSYRQKWNAPPLGQGAGLSNTWETTAS